MAFTNPPPLSCGRGTVADSYSVGGRFKSSLPHEGTHWSGAMSSSLRHGDRCPALAAASDTDRSAGRRIHEGCCLTSRPRVCGNRRVMAERGSHEEASSGVAPLPARAERISRFWDTYLRSLPPLQRRDRTYYEAFAFGDSPEMADRLGALVLDGVKTATSELLWERQTEDGPLWGVGDEHVVLDGRGNPVCVIRTTELRVVPFDRVDERFAWDYGEGDRTLAWWRENVGAYYEERCRSLSRTASEDMPLICERFEVVYPARAA